MYMANDNQDEEVPREFETETTCPSCGAKLFFIFYRTRISYEEAVEIETFFCKKCLYKSSQIKPLERESPRKLVLAVRNHDDLRVILYRSPEARIEIPELEAEITPGEISTGEITTIEGVLTKLLEKLELFDEEDANIERLNSVKKRISDIIDGNDEPFTIVVDDPIGKSRLNSSRVITIRKSEE